MNKVFWLLFSSGKFPWPWALALNTTPKKGFGGTVSSSSQQQLHSFSVWMLNWGCKREPSLFVRIHTQGWRCSSVGRVTPRLAHTKPVQEAEGLGDLMPVTLALRWRSRRGEPKFRVVLSYIWQVRGQSGPCETLPEVTVSGRKMVQQINELADGAWRPQANPRDTLKVDREKRLWSTLTYTCKHFKCSEIK